MPPPSPRSSSALRASFARREEQKHSTTDRNQQTTGLQQSARRAKAPTDQRTSPAEPTRRERSNAVRNPESRKLILQRLRSSSGVNKDIILKKAGSRPSGETRSLGKDNKVKEASPLVKWIPRDDFSQSSKQQPNATRPSTATRLSRSPSPSSSIRASLFKSSPSRTKYSTPFASLRSKSGLLKSAYEKRHQGSAIISPRRAAQEGRGSVKSPESGRAAAITGGASEREDDASDNRSSAAAPQSSPRSPWTPNSKIERSSAAFSLLPSSDEEREARLRMTVDKRWNDNPMEEHVFNYPRKRDDIADQSFETRLRMFGTTLQKGDNGSSIMQSSGARSTYTSSEGI